MVVFQITKHHDGYLFKVVEHLDELALEGQRHFASIFSILVKRETAIELWDEKGIPNAVRNFVAQGLGLQDGVTCRFIDENGNDL